MYLEHYIDYRNGAINEIGRWDLRDNKFWGLSVEFQGSRFRFRVTTVTD